MTKICTPPVAWDWAGPLPNTYSARVAAEGKRGFRPKKIEWHIHRGMTNVPIADRPIYRGSVYLMLRPDGASANPDSDGEYDGLLEPTVPSKNVLGDKEVRLYIGTAYKDPPDPWARKISRGDIFIAWAKPHQPKKIQRLKKLSDPGYDAWRDPDGPRGLNKLWGHWKTRYGKTPWPRTRTSLRLEIHDEDPTQVTGTTGEYDYDAQEFVVTGTVKGTLKANGKRLTGTWREKREVLPDKAGTFVFNLNKDWESFTGTYETDEGIGGHWNGKR